MPGRGWGDRRGAKNAERRENAICSPRRKGRKAGGEFNCFLVNSRRENTFYHRGHEGNTEATKRWEIFYLKFSFS